MWLAAIGSFREERKTQQATFCGPVIHIFEGPTRALETSAGVKYLNVISLALSI